MSLDGGGTQWYLTVRFNLCDGKFDLAGVFVNYFVAWLVFWGPITGVWYGGGGFTRGEGDLKILIYLCYLAFT